MIRLLSNHGEYAEILSRRAIDNPLYPVRSAPADSFRSLRRLALFLAGYGIQRFVLGGSLCARLVLCCKVAPSDIDIYLLLVYSL